MSNKNNKLSVFISLVLRHKPEQIDIKLDEFGYADVNELIDGVNNSGRNIDFNTLEKIVSSDQKGRYSFNEDKTRIRANQGHSIDVKVPMKELAPPNFLYHGTAQKNIESISKNGIKKMSRNYVHLSDNTETATQVGSRHGEPIILIVDALKMHKDGFKFYLSENNVWQINFVPSEYIFIMK